MAGAIGIEGAVKDRRGHVKRRVVEVPAPEPDLSAARAVVLVEGASDRIALEAAARRSGFDLAAAGVVVWSAGGVGNFATLAARFGPAGAGVPLFGLCDAAEVAWVCRALLKAGVGIAPDRAGLGRLGFQVCDRDLEDELIRAVGVAGVEALFEAEGDLTAFRALQSQKPWAGAAPGDQMRRFLRVGARRKRRYAEIFVAALNPGRIPDPLVALLAALPGLRAGLQAGPVLV